MKKKSITEIVHFFIQHSVQDSLRGKFWHWLMFSADAPEKEKALQQEWMDMIVAPDKSTQRSWHEVRRKAGLETHSAFKRRWEISPFLRVASMLLIPLLSIALSWYYIDSSISSSELVEYTVPMGERGEITLPDGTMVQVNSESSIIYPKRFRGETRTVHLSGEANFDVHKDKKHPFIVKTSLLAVRALGTKFNIQAYAEDRKTITTLENGKVQITNLLASNDSSFILVPDEQLEYDHLTKKYEKRKIDAMVTAGWTRGELNFIDCDLANILNTLKRHYNVEIKAEPYLYTNDLYTIKLKKNESLQSAIRIITMTVGGMESRFTNDNVVILTALTPPNKNKEGGVRP
ncbi:FecR family protein [uncultured Bacteroides sp.]|uniref:FecR family protein n=1 Tax=uncultured Bacteroides sp. TaxID=162156 RepID=UPI0025D54361|nr:FecR family protein [uncultured Bacteroides sp.]